MRNTERKAKVTPETQEESRKLRELWDAAKDRPSQAVFADRYGIGSQTAVATFLKGTTPISKKAASGFAAGLGCKIEDFSPRLAAEIAGLAESIAESTQDVHLRSVLSQLTPEQKEMLIKMATGLIAPSIPMSSEEYFKTGKGRGNPSHAADELSIPKNKDTSKI